MKIYLEMTTKELKSCFNQDQNIKRMLMDSKFDIKIGDETFSCMANHIRWESVTAWSLEPDHFKIEAHGKSKRDQEVTEAIACVNKAKEQYKEAQRKLSELNGPKAK